MSQACNPSTRVETGRVQSSRSSTVSLRPAYAERPWLKEKILNLNFPKAFEFVLTVTWKSKGPQVGLHSYPGHFLSALEAWAHCCFAEMKAGLCGCGDSTSYSDAQLKRYQDEFALQLCY